MQEQGMFISFEGPEGAGKTSVLRAILERLAPKLQDRLLITREPGGHDNAIAERIRDVVLDPAYIDMMDPWTEALLYAASRRQHVEGTIKPALATGKVVITDRYVDSSIAYQGAGRGLGTDKIAAVNDFAIQGLYPNRTIYLDLDPQVGLDRIMQNRQNEINRLDLDGIDFHRRVSAAYHELATAQSDRFVMIDASQPLAKVIDDVWLVLVDLLNLDTSED
ncbi:dTMP kinase [Weissella muntiaci]|uniref:Thymidylate kinase n=1 Tax=Weissella muntiaci TaxID=2508881 RepID=A0A6C2C5G5_9LACO|nr:dTMP kinase [Weissella muntiaci]TYC48909.1 dTMP kinase [Weissella muntiaci]